MLLRADGEPWTMSHQLRPIADAGAAARLEPPATFHALRHTWASHRVMAGAPLMVVAQALGHADTRMVEKHYGHLAPSYVRDVIRATALGIGAGEPRPSPPPRAARGDGRLPPAGAVLPGHRPDRGEARHGRGGGGGRAAPRVGRGGHRLAMAVAGRPARHFRASLTA